VGGLSTDTISSDEGPERLPRTRWPRPAATGGRTTALSAAVALVLAGGVATAAYRSSTDAADPAELIPASAFAVATVDLGVSGDTLGDFADHFPGSPTHRGDGSATDRLLRAMLRDSTDPHVDYDEDVRPWLGDHAAVAGWLDGDTPRFEVLLESRDDASARQHLGAVLGEDASMVVHDGHVVVSDTTEHANAAIAAAVRSSLVDSPAYRDDVAALPDGAAVVGWLDGPGAEKALRSAMGGGVGSADGLFGGPMTMFDPGGGSAFDERLTVGLRVSADTVQADMRSVGGKAGASAPSSMLTGLPTGTIGALELSAPDTLVRQGLTMMRELTGLGMQMASDDCYATGFDGGVTRGDGSGALLVVPDGTPYGSQFCAHPDSLDPLEQIRTATGLDLPDDAETILGDRAVLAFGGITLSGPPDVALRSHPADLAAARELAETLAAHLQKAVGFAPTVAAAGDELVLATSQGYAHRVAEGGALGDDAAFNRAMGEIPARVGRAGFVDLTRVWPLVGVAGSDAEHLHAVGFWTAPDGDGAQVAQLRLVAG
jgi:hypothetical protein